MGKFSIPQGFSLQARNYQSSFLILRNGTLVAGCKDGRCIVNLAGEEVRVLGNIHEGGVIDSSFNDATIIIRGKDKLYYYSGSSWNKEVERDAGFISAAVSPGGEYTVVTKGPSGSNSLIVFDQNGEDVTPEFKYDDVRYVEANDRGIFFSSVRSNKLTYYQLGKYASEYNPPTTTQAGQTNFGGLEVYISTENEFSTFDHLVSWDWLPPFGIYRATQSLKINTSWGTLSVGEGTIFSKDGSGYPILLWGQAEVETGTPITMTVIKNKLLDLASFQEKMDKLFNATLPESDYVLIHNLHTKYKVQMKDGTVKVTVSKGEVETTFKSQKTNITVGKKLIIDAKDNVTVRKVLPKIFYIVIFGILLGIITFLEIKFKNASWIKRINTLAKESILAIGSSFLKLMRVLFKGLKALILWLVKTITKIIRRNK